MRPWPAPSRSRTPPRSSQRSAARRPTASSTSRISSAPAAPRKLINAAKDRPQANAAAMFPAAARANRSIFYDRQGNARSVAGVYAELDRRYQVARANVMPGVAPTAVAANAAAPRPSPARRRRRRPTPPARPTPSPVALRAPVAASRRAGVPLAVPQQRRTARRGGADRHRIVGRAAPRTRRHPAATVLRPSPRGGHAGAAPSRSICSRTCGRTCAACSGAATAFDARP